MSDLIEAHSRAGAVPRHCRRPASTRLTTATALTAPYPATHVTLAGADWLASATERPEDTHAHWAANPAAPTVLPCGTVFDVINVPALFGRTMVDRLWSTGPGTGPVARYRDRMLLFAAPGTAPRLPALLAWEEWGPAVPPPLCHGTGDAVTVPPLHAVPDGTRAPRWLVAPDVREPWLPGPEVLLWACVRAARATRGRDVTAYDKGPHRSEGLHPSVRRQGLEPRTR